MTLIRSRWNPPLRLDQASDLQLRVWPTEADLSLMNHAAFLTAMEQGRIDYMCRTGFLKLFRLRRWSPVVGSLTIQYRSTLRRLQRFRLQTRVSSWDDDWIYLEHRMSRGDKLVASALAKVAVLGPGGRIRPQEALEAAGATFPQPAEPGMIQALREGERLMHDRISRWTEPAAGAAHED